MVCSLKQQREIEHGIGVVRRDPQRCAQAFNGGLSASLLVQQVAQVVPSIRECRIDARRGAQGGFGLDVAGRGPEQVAEIERCRRI